MAPSARYRRATAWEPMLATSSSTTADRLCAGEHDRGEARLHVVRTAAVEAAVLDERLVSAVHSGDADGVHVRVEHERAPAAGAARDPDDVRPSRRDLLHVDVEPGALQPLGDEAGDVGLPRGARNQLRVDRVDGDELLRELGELTHMA
jgi:hypothetical protein